jgi:deoxyribodipyrimidine photo-lyase
MTGSAIFIFRRDYRVNDNTALLKACATHERVHAIFIFDPAQYLKSRNAYFSRNSFQFLIESLVDLQKQLDGRLSVFDGTPSKVLDTVLKRTEARAVYVNSDVTPFSKSRDEAMAEVCKANGAEFISCDDILINPIGTVLTGSGDYFKVFTPFWRASLKITPPKPVAMTAAALKKIAPAISTASIDHYRRYYEPYNPHVPLKGGRTVALKHLASLFPEMCGYERLRNDPTRYATMLSAINKYGVLSIREVYWTIRTKCGERGTDLIRQLYWRDFYYNIAHYNPQVFRGAWREKFNKVKWADNPEGFRRWCEGRTGVPFVDAGMRQLNKTGFMHNRLRMVVSQFLMKDLGIDWRDGERYFAQLLYDYDPSQNNGGWQWSSGSGNDSQPYFRVFNPYRQSERFDPDAVYIKRWVPELRDVPARDLQDWEATHKKWESTGYPAPMVIHKDAVIQTLKMYRRYL